jgi:hypothetical protein
MNQKITMEWWYFAIVALLIIIFFLLNRKYNFSETWIRTIEKFAPYWLTFFPAFITYFCVCGTLSAFAVLAYSGIVGGKDNFERDSFLMMENGVEFTCSLVMPCIYFIVLKRNNFHWLWMGIITVVHVLAAGYRDAKLILLENDDEDGKTFESGPIILDHFEYLDGLVPVISLLIFLFFFNKKPTVDPEPVV